MKWTDYCKDKGTFIVMNALVATFSAFLLYMVDEGWYFTLFVPCIYLVGCAAALLPEFIMKNHYYSELRNTLEELDKKYLLSEIMEEPSFYEGKILYDALKDTNQAMNDEVAYLSRTVAEYREYVEMWVHEIKNPIAGAKLMAENSSNESMLAELDKIDQFVQQALYYSRSGSVEKDYLIKQVTLEALVNGALRASAKGLIAHNVAVERTGLEHMVRTDVKWAGFILRQIIDNSIKYGCKKLKISGRPHEGGVSLILADDGVGMPEGDVKRVFDKGFTGENGRMYGKSTGIGLYLCKKLCMKLGLGVSARSTLGGGTSIAIKFPQRELL